VIEDAISDYNEFARNGSGTEFVIEVEARGVYLARLRGKGWNKGLSERTGFIVRRPPESRN
jgi:hypothetical protein